MTLRADSIGLVVVSVRHGDAGTLNRTTVSVSSRLSHGLTASG